MTKTNVMRMLDAEKIDYRTAEYEYSETDLSGVHAAKAINMPAEQVFKTLVTKGDKTGPIVFVIPVAEELDLKKAAKISQNKSIEMLHVKDLLGLTGYIRGGCSPIGMKKKLTTYIDETAVLFEEISISAGVRGSQVIINPEVLVGFIDAKQADLTF